MPSLSKSDARFGIRFTLIEGGSGEFEGVITEPDQGEVPSYQFTLPRRLLKVPEGLPLLPGSVIQDPDGTTFLVAHHGVSESRGLTLFRNFRLFEAPQQYEWQKRKKKMDLVSRVEMDDGLTTPAAIWGCYEPSPEQFDRALRSSFESGRFITNRQIARDDLIDKRKVSRVDQQLGLYLCTLG